MSGTFFLDASEKFLVHWNTRVHKGEVSGFTRIEFLVIRIFAQWLDENYGGPTGPQGGDGHGGIGPGRLIPT